MRMYCFDFLELLDGHDKLNKTRLQCHLRYSVHVVSKAIRMRPRSTIELVWILALNVSLKVKGIL